MCNHVAMSNPGSKGPLEAWIVKVGIGISCRISYNDGDRVDLVIKSPLMRGAQHEVSRWAKAQGYEPAGRWAFDSYAQARRVFRPVAPAAA